MKFLPPNLRSDVHIRRTIRLSYSGLSTHYPVNFHFLLTGLVNNFVCVQIREDLNKYLKFHDVWSDHYDVFTSFSVSLIFRDQGAWPHAGLSLLKV